jgi:hypothetical protein
MGLALVNRLEVKGKAEIFKDMPHLRKKMNVIDKDRKMKIKNAKETRNFKEMILRWAEERSEDKVLNQTQRMAIHLLTDFVHNYSYAYISKYLCIAPATLSNWRNQPLFIRELDKEITRRKSFVRVHAFRNINRSIMRGNVKDSWKYLEMTGDLKKGLVIEDNTGEKELSDEELEQQIGRMIQKQSRMSPSHN